MQKTKLLVAALGIMFAAPVLADDAPASPNTFSSNVSLVSDYIYRGISQTDNKPAIQGGFDYSHSSGFYAGVWGSSISWIEDTTSSFGSVNSSLELDTYFGLKGTLVQDTSFDVGFLRYNYPGTYPDGFTKADTNEIYGAIGYKFLTAKLSYCLGDLFGVSDAKGSTYIDLSASYPVADSGITLSAHAGKQTYKGTTADALDAAGASATYTDYRLGVSKDLGGYALALTYTKTNADSGGFYTNAFGRDLGKGTAVISLSRSF
jgi:uncharacterized protein (TIGR02001 family)